MRETSIIRILGSGDSDTKFSSALADQRENSYRVFDWFYKSKLNLLKKALITII